MEAQELLKIIPPLHSNGDEETNESVFRALGQLPDTWKLVVVYEPQYDTQDEIWVGDGTPVNDLLETLDPGDDYYQQFMTGLVFELSNPDDLGKIYEATDIMEEMGRYPKSHADESAEQGCEIGQSFSCEIYYKAGYVYFWYWFDDSTR